MSLKPPTHSVGKKPKQGAKSCIKLIAVLVVMSNLEGRSYQGGGRILAGETEVVMTSQLNRLGELSTILCAQGYPTTSSFIRKGEELSTYYRLKKRQPNSTILAPSRSIRESESLLPKKGTKRKNPQSGGKTPPPRGNLVASKPFTSRDRTKEQ